MPTRPYRFLVKENDAHPGVWDVYRAYACGSKEEFVGSITDKQTLQLLLRAPALEQMHGSSMRARDYSQRTLSNYCLAFVSYFRRLS